MSNKYLAVESILQGAQEAINTILTDQHDDVHLIRTNNGLQKLIDQLLLMTGTTGTGTTLAAPTVILGPATSIAGTPIKKLKTFTEADLLPSDDKVLALKNQVQAAVQYFNPSANATGLLATIPENVIRGVAKYAGMEVTKEEPKTLTVEFVEEIIDSLEDMEWAEQVKAKKAKGAMLIDDPLTESTDQDKENWDKPLLKMEGQDELAEALKKRLEPKTDETTSTDQAKEVYKDVMDDNGMADMFKAAQEAEKATKNAEQESGTDTTAKAEPKKAGRPSTASKANEDKN